MEGGWWRCYEELKLNLGDLKYREKGGGGVGV